jgi:hypothetical protein
MQYNNLQASSYTLDDGPVWLNMSFKHEINDDSANKKLH